MLLCAANVAAVDDANLASDADVDAAAPNMVAAATAPKVVAAAAPNVVAAATAPNVAIAAAPNVVW